MLIIGTGQRGLVCHGENARQFLGEKGCHVRLLPTPEADQLWNRTEGAVIALLRITWQRLALLADSPTLVP